MTALLAKLAPRQAIGVHVGEKELALSQVASTLLGPVEVRRTRVAYKPDELGAALAAALRSFPGRKRRPLAIGLVPQRVLFSTRPIRSANLDARPETLLHEVLQSPNLSSEDMIVDVVKARPGHRQVAGIVCCRRKYMSDLLAALHGCPARLRRVEPSPCALLRAAVRRYPTPRRARVVLRVFLGEEQGLAVVTAGRLPIIWRLFELRAGAEAEAILSIARALQTLEVHCGVDSPIAAVMVHGRPDLHEAFEATEFQEKLAVRLSCHEGPALDAGAIAHGLALGCLEQTDETFDLARGLKPPLSWRELMPWGELAVVAALLLCMALFLDFRRSSVEEHYMATRAQNRQRSWLASMTDAQLTAEKQDLERRLEAVNRFLSSRVLWTSEARELAARLPARASLTALQGVSELELPGKGKDGPIQGKKFLAIKAAVPAPADGAVPREIDGYLESLRAAQSLKQDFPIVELGDIKLAQSQRGGGAIATFSILCLPRPAKSVPGKQPVKQGGRP